MKGVADVGLRDFLRQAVLPPRDKLRNGTAPYLEPGEQIQAVFLAARWTPWYAPANRADCAVAATNRRILLLKLDSFGRVAGVAGEAPRETRLGPWSGEQLRIRAFGTDLVVGSGSYMDVAEADRAMGFDWPADMHGLDDLHIERNLPGTEFDR